MRRCIALGLLTLLLGLPIACASDGDVAPHADLAPIPHADLAPIWRDFLAMPAQRAMAIAGDPRRDRWVVGMTGGHREQGHAQAEAIRQCNLRRGVRRMQAACVLYAVGSEVVWQTP